MAKHRVEKAFQFLCTACGGELSNPGAVITVDNEVFITSYCENCEHAVNVKLVAILTELYGKDEKGN